RVRAADCGVGCEKDRTRSIQPEPHMVVGRHLEPFGLHRGVRRVASKTGGGGGPRVLRHTLTPGCIRNPWLYPHDVTLVVHLLLCADEAYLRRAERIAAHRGRGDCLERCLLLLAYLHEAVRGVPVARTTPTSKLPVATGPPAAMHL